MSYGVNTGSSTPTANTMVKSTASGLVRGAVAVCATFQKTAITADTALNYAGLVTGEFVVPSGWKLDIYAISMMTPTDPANGSIATVKLYGASGTTLSADLSGNFPTLSVTGTAGADGMLCASVEPTSSPYTVDATGGVYHLTLHGASTVTAVGIIGTILGCLYKP